MTSKIELSFATKEDIEEFYDGPALYSCRAVVARLDGKIVGLGGVYRVGKNMVVFSEIREEMRPYKKDIIRACRMALTLVNRHTQLVSYEDPAHATAATFGEHFGFHKTGTTLEGKEIRVRVNNGPN